MTNAPATIAATTMTKQACIFGGTGFIGRQIVGALAREGYRIKVVTRAPESAYFLKTAGNPGQIAAVPFYRGDDATLREAVAGCDVVVNCIGILAERGKSGFTRLHTELPRAIAKACVAEKAGRFIHLSAIACDLNHSKYGKSKRNGELAIFENFPAATILRPAVVFGADDNFFNLFARMAQIMPFLPLIGGGKTRFQPVYAGDVAKAVTACLRRPESKGAIYELGGPEILDFRALYERLFLYTGRKRALVSLPWGFAKFQGALMNLLLPDPPLTPDQVESLKTNAVCSGDWPGLQDLGITATPLDAVLPSYLSRFRPGGRFAAKKKA